MSTQELTYWLAASHLSGLSPNTFRKCLAFFPSISALFQANLEEWKTKGLSEKIFTSVKTVNWAAIEISLKWAEQPDHHIIIYDDQRYPALLKEIHDPPLLLYVSGSPEVLPARQIAIVGARHASSMGLKNAAWFARGLVEQGWVVTSGLAMGIDAASHQGALDCKGQTIAVCAAGLNHIYPSSHRGLFEAIVQSGGATVSEMPPATRPHARLFPKRNRLISGLSYGVLVVEAALKSGSLITARCALEQGREVFAVPGPIHHPLSKGCHWLIRQGAKLVDAVSEIVDEWGASIAKPAPVWGEQSVALMALDTRSQAILNAIGYEITPLDVILLRCGLTLGELSSILLILELDGYIQSVSGGYIRAIS